MWSRRFFSFSLGQKQTQNTIGAQTKHASRVVRDTERELSYSGIWKCAVVGQSRRGHRVGGATISRRRWAGQGMVMMVVVQLVGGVGVGVVLRLVVQRIVVDVVVVVVATDQRDMMARRTVG